MASVDLVLSSPPLTGPPWELVFGALDAPVAPLRAADLIFSNTPLIGPPWNLVFGEADAVVAPLRTFDLDATFPDLALDGFATLVISATLDATFPALTLEGVARAVGWATLDSSFPAMTFEAEAFYDNRLTRYLNGRTSFQHNPAIPARPSSSTAWGISQSQRGGTDAHWQPAATHRIGADVRHGLTLVYKPAFAALWQIATQISAASASAYQRGSKRVSDAQSAYQLALMLRYLSTSGMQTGVNLRNYQRAPWQLAEHFRRAHQGRSGASLHRTGRQSEVGRWQHGMHPRTGRSSLPLPLPPVVSDPCYLPEPNLLFDTAWSSDLNLVFFCERHSITPPAPGEMVVVPIRKVYMVFNDASLRRVDGNIALPSSSFTLSLDVDSWAWGFSCALPGRVLSDLEPGSSGAPVELEAMVNGTAFRVLVESLSRERSFGKNDIRVQGRGKTALLDSPYAPVRNFGNTAERTAQQLMGDALSVNGVPMDWALNWGLSDWLVPANVFAHQGSYISALNAIAAAAGGYIQPHASLQSLDVLARYPVAPWQWNTVTPDFELPADVTTREGIEWIERARYNRVFVSGQQSGILGQVTRAGTAGDVLAPMVTDALITTAAAARQRGISVLGNTGRQANITLRLPVLPETGVITPGKFVRYVDAGAARLGIVRSVNVDAGFPNVWQSIGVETHV